jgi:hypothetical protein
MIERTLINLTKQKRQFRGYLKQKWFWPTSVKTIIDWFLQSKVVLTGFGFLTLKYTYIYNITHVSHWGRQRSVPSNYYDNYIHLLLLLLSSNSSLLIRFRIRFTCDRYIIRHVSSFTYISHIYYNSDVTQKRRAYEMNSFD